MPSYQITQNHYHLCVSDKNRYVKRSLTPSGLIYTLQLRPSCCINGQNNQVSLTIGAGSGRLTFEIQWYILNTCALFLK